jgi:hypothetical protein
MSQVAEGLEVIVAVFMVVEVVELEVEMVGMHLILVPKHSEWGVAQAKKELQEKHSVVYVVLLPYMVGAVEELVEEEEQDGMVVILEEQLEGEEVEFFQVVEDLGEQRHHTVHLEVQGDHQIMWDQ